MQHALDTQMTVSNGATSRRIPALMTVAFTLLCVGCGASDTTAGTAERTEAVREPGLTERSDVSTPVPATEATGADEVFFPQLQRPTDTPEMTTAGKLTLDDRSCLRVTDDGDETVPIWPPGFELSAEDGRIQILDRQGLLRATVGERVLIGGWQVGVPSQLAVLDDSTGRELRRRCPGDYWISDGRMRIPG
jgi:hypothetical protein